MYYITYYKTKRTIDNPKESNNLRIRKIIHNPYLNGKKEELIDKCLNIKSLTIDLEDIKYVKYAMKDKDIKHLVSLYVLINRVSFDAADAITILNNNYLNWLFIYEIINCKWMVNKDEEPNNEDILNAINRFLSLLEQYENTSEQYIKRKIKYEMNIIKYYLKTLIDLKNNNQTSKPISKTLKLGKKSLKISNNKKS